MKKLLPTLGLGLLILAQASSADDPSDGQHFIYQLGQITVDIYGYRNSVVNGELAYKRIDKDTPFNATEQACAEKQLTEIRGAIPKSRAADYKGKLIIQIDISNVPPFPQSDAWSGGWSAIEVKAPYLFLRPNFDPRQKPDCLPYPSITLIQALNTIVGDLPADQAFLKKSLNELDKVVAPPFSPGRLTVSPKTLKEEQTTPSQPAASKATAGSGG